MKVFADEHHQDLAYSLHLLFEHRLGYELYKPIGLEWFEQGYWDIAKPYGNNPGTINQYLEKRTQQFYPDGCPHRLMTLEEFQETDIDIVLASIPDHFETYTRLIKDHKPNAKLVCH